jgi:SAM-dependent methyltransferase
VTVLLGGASYFAPISNPKQVLDVATGTGIWAVEFAEKHPYAAVLGTDLSAIQPQNAPPNCTFIKDDSESEWVFPVKFDYVHLRFVFSCFDHPKAVMQNAFNSMEPEGWIEYTDVAVEQAGNAGGRFEGTALQKWCRAAVTGASVALGRDIAVTQHYKKWLEEVGFTNVHEKKMIWPLSPWSTDKRLRLAGAYMQKNLEDGGLLSGWKALRASGLSEEEARSVIDGAKGEMRDRRNQLYFVIYVVYGQKP